MKTGRILGVSEASKRGEPLHIDSRLESSHVTTNDSPDDNNRIYKFFRKWFKQDADRKYQEYLSREGCYDHRREDGTR